MTEQEIRELIVELGASLLLADIAWAVLEISVFAWQTAI